MLEKQVVISRIEVLEDGQMQIRQTIRILEDGKVISEAFHRHVVEPDKEDITDQHPRVQAIASSLWTKEVKDSYIAKKEELKISKGVVVPKVEEVPNTQELPFTPEVPNDPELMP